MLKRQTLDALQQRFEQVLAAEELDVELLTELFAQISAAVNQFQLDAVDADTASKQLADFSEWLSVTIAKVDTQKLTVAHQLISLQKSRNASKSYSLNQE